MVQVEDPNAPEDEQGAQHKQKRRSRQKALSVVLMMGLTTFCRSPESNVLQTMIGFYLFSTSTGKRVMGVFDHLGICISYDAVREALRNNAQKVRTELCARAAFRWTTDLAYIRQPNQQKQRSSAKKNPVPTEACVGHVGPVRDEGTRARTATSARTYVRSATGVSLESERVLQRNVRANASNGGFHP
jgi:hypothetical protein